MTETPDDTPARRPEPPAPAAHSPATAAPGRSGAAGVGRSWRMLSTRLSLEFAVVVFGVFVALWADARVAARAERRTEAARLEALHAGITTTLAELRDFIGDLRNDGTRLRDLLVPPAGNDGASATSGGAVASALLGGVSPFHPQLVVYDDLRSSGELSLLDPAVRTTLAAMDQWLRRLQEAQQDLQTVQQLNFDAFAMRNVDLLPLLGDFLDLRWNAGSASPAQYEALVRTREFRNLAVFRLDLLTNVLGIAEQLEEALDTASTAIDQRLERLR